MSIKFSDLMKITKKTKLEERLKIFKTFIPVNLLNHRDYIEIANAILENSLAIKKKLLRRDMPPLEYFRISHMCGAAFSENNLIYDKNFDYKERAAGEQNERRNVMNFLEMHSKNIAYYFADIYKNYFLNVDVNGLFNMMPKDLKLYKGVKKYIAMYWEYITPPYDLVLHDARTMVLNTVEKDFKNSGDDEVNWHINLVSEQLNNLDKYYTKHINFIKN